VARKLRVTVAYDGTDFLGWQIQRNGRTVQGVIQSALERMHGHPVKVTAAGRTDSGVHARGQVISLETDLLSLPPERFARALANYLPPDVSVYDSFAVPETFSARKSARLRIYRYYFHFGRPAFPHMRRYSVWRNRRPTLERLNRLAAAVEGRQDFSVFAASGDQNESKIRLVTTSSFYPCGSQLVYKIAAGSFLRRMVRAIVGTLMELEARDADPLELRDIIQSLDRGRAGQTAPAHGLFLDRVLYAGEETHPF
jgi:tRNA pseudouridine38-40 synthase